MISREVTMFRSNHAWRITGRSMLLAASLGMLSTVGLAQEIAPGLRAVPNALLSIDQNRQTVVDRIVADWGEALSKSNAGITVDQLRATLSAMRSDYLLAASVVGSLDGLRSVVASSLTGAAPANDKHIASKTLGDAADDLVYTPIPPCRLFDTRVSQGGLGTPALTVRRTYGAVTPVTNQGGPGGCAAGAGAVVALLQIGTLTPSGSGILQGGPQGVASFPNALVLYQAGDQYGTAVAMPLNPANNQFDLVELFATADLYADLLGYFATPVATALQCTQVASSATVIPVSSDTNVPLPACAAGYSRTGSNCSGTNGTPSGYLIETNAAGCVFRNLSAVATYNGTATSVCCRVPGR